MISEVSFTSEERPRVVRLLRFFADQIERTGKIAMDPNDPVSLEAGEAAEIIQQALARSMMDAAAGEAGQDSGVLA